MTDEEILEHIVENILKPMVNSAEDNEIFTNFKDFYRVSDSTDFAEHLLNEIESLRTAVKITESERDF